MSTCRRQALIEAPVETVWDLLGNPSRHPEWWPRVIEIDGERYEEGDEYVQITRGPMGSDETRWLVEHRDDLRGIRLRCQLTGTYADWHLTGAQGGTFVELEMGMDPKRLGYRVFDLTIGSRYFRKWAEESIDALGDVAKSDPAPAGNL
jgi:hypothetical protein